LSGFPLWRDSIDFSVIGCVFFPDNRPTNLDSSPVLRDNPNRLPEIKGGVPRMKSPEPKLPPNEEPFLLLSDAPYTGAEDPLGFDKYAEGLAKLIFDSRDSTPLTLGIQASWGMGKSTLMSKLKDSLAAHKGIETVWFNAWTFEGKDMLEGLIKTALEKVDPHILRRALRNQKVMTALRLSTTLIAGWFQVGKVVDSLWESISVDPRARNQIQTILKNAMEDWIAKTPEDAQGRLLVVFIEDLDRCSPDNVLQVFEAIKLYLEALGFVFVIGFDQNIVSEAILEQKKYSKKITSGRYIEKIIQIDYTIPRSNEDQIRDLFKKCVKDSRTERLLGEAEEKLITERSDRNPRRIKRFINRFVLEHKLDEDTANIEPDVLIKTLMLQLYFGEFCALFNERSLKDPIKEFLDYLELRKMLTSEGAIQSERADELLNFYNLSPPTDREGLESTRTALEEAVPEEFHELMQNSDFVSLVDSLDSEEDQKLVSERILRKRELAELAGEAEEVEGVAPPPRADALKSLRVLWIDDHPDGNQALIDEIRNYGARLEIVTDGEAARKYLESRPDWANMIISDIRRSGQDNAGFDDLKTFLDDGLYDGPVIFYASRVTPLRRKRAEELNAYGITNRSAKLIEMLRSKVEAEEYQFSAINQMKMS
jgi:CheY-like chemotaxis protein